MPSNYTGDPTATQAPSPPPDPAVFPIVALPVDADPPNGSTFEQAYKVLADFIAWLMAPFAKASQWAVGIMTFRTAALHTRFLVDHLGLPGGRIIDWREWWPSVKLRGGGALSDTYFDDAGNLPGWYARIVNPGGPTILMSMKPADNTIVGRHRYVQMNVYGAGGSGLIWREPPCEFQAGNHVVWEHDLELEDSTNTNKVYSIGIGVDDAAGVPAASQTGGTEASKIRFFYDPGSGPNWMCETRSGGTGAAPFDSGIAADDNFHRFRIEWHGENVADDAARAVRMYIDGALVFTETTMANLPLNKQATPVITVEASGAGGSAASMFVGPVHFAANLWDSDVV